MKTIDTILTCKGERKKTVTSSVEPPLQVSRPGSGLLINWHIFFGFSIDDSFLDHC